VLNFKGKKISAKIFIYIFIIFIVGSYIYAKLTSDLPLNLPEVTIKYEDKKVPTTHGEYTWLSSFSKDQPKAGNSNLAGPSYDLGMDLSRFVAKTNSEIEIVFEDAPPEITLRRWTVGDSENETSEKIESFKKVNTIKLPDKKGEYIYEVRGNWSHTNFTVTVFRVLVE